MGKWINGETGKMVKDNENTLLPGAWGLELRLRSIDPGPRPPAPELRTPNGFTLLELLLVLVILAVAATLVVPAIGTRFTSADPRQVMVQLRAAMELMRVRAIEDG